MFDHCLGLPNLWRAVPALCEYPNQADNCILEPRSRPDIVSMAGGGFFPESDSQGANSPAKGKNFTNVNNLRSLTIRQLQESEVNPDGRPVVDGQELAQFTVIGCVRSVRTGSTGTDYTVEDGTSSISAKCWLDKHIEAMPEGSWVRIYGSLKSLANMKSITVASMRRISDYNEVTFHFLESMITHVAVTRPGLLGSSSSKTPSKLVKMESNYAEDQNLTPIQRAVFDVYRGSTDEIGIHVSSVIRALKGRYSEDDIKSSITSLISEGLLYLTIDSDHARHVMA